MSRGLVDGGEDASRLHDVVGTCLSPGDLCRVLRVEHLQNRNYFAILKNSIDLDAVLLSILSLHDERVLVMGNGALETTVSRVVL